MPIISYGYFFVGILLEREWLSSKFQKETLLGSLVYEITLLILFSLIYLKSESGLSLFLIKSLLIKSFDVESSNLLSL